MVTIMKNLKKVLTAFFVAGSLIILITACGQNGEAEIINGKKLKASVSNNGLTISFPSESPGLQQIAVTEAKKGTEQISVKVPARVVASISQSLSSTEKIILFDSPDVTSLFSSYKQSKSNVDRTTRNYERVKDMYGNQMSTAKDLNDAENDLILAKSSVLEMEARMRALGFNPQDLEKSPANIVWLIADVSESQLKEVQKGETVEIYFSSFPEKQFIGRAEAIGDVIDPVTRSIKVRITMPNNGKFLPGMFATVDFGDPVNSVVSLPNSSIVTVEGKDYSFVETSHGTFERREVFVGNSNSSRAIIIKGIENGEKVVTDGTILLKGLSFGY